MTLQRTATKETLMSLTDKFYSTLQEPKAMIGMHFPHIRLTIEQKRRCKHFSEAFKQEEYKYIDFGKQDIRGSISITYFDHRHCVPKQQHFSDKSEMLGYIDGYLDCIGNN